MFPDILKLIITFLAQCKLNKSESFCRETWRGFFGSYSGRHTVHPKRLAMKTLEAISFEVVVITLARCLKESWRADWWFKKIYTFYLFLVQAVISLILCKLLVVLSHKNYTLTVIVWDKRHIRWNKLSLINPTSYSSNLVEYSVLPSTIPPPPTLTSP